jgi:DNA-binding protein H-NS|nr:H-NS histone family protein [Rhodoferax sp.]
MNSLVDIQNQIQKLQKQASEIRNREFDKTVQEIVAKMQAFGIAIKDLQIAMAGGRKRAGKAKPAGATPTRVKGPKKSKSGVAVAAKYRGPQGETWSGRGLTPRWMASLLAQGKTKEDFAIKA